MTEQEKQTLRNMCENLPIASLIDVIHDYCGNRGIDQALNVKERKDYRMLRNRLDRPLTFAREHNL